MWKSWPLQNECSKIANGKGKSNSNPSSRGIRAYITWEDDDTISVISDTENDEVEKLCFMGQVYPESNSESNPSYEELQRVVE